MGDNASAGLLIFVESPHEDNPQSQPDVISPHAQLIPLGKGAYHPPPTGMVSFTGKVHLTRYAADVLPIAEYLRGELESCQGHPQIRLMESLRPDPDDPNQLRKLYWMDGQEIREADLLPPLPRPVILVCAVSPLEDGSPERLMLRHMRANPGKFEVVPIYGSRSPYGDHPRIKLPWMVTDALMDVVFTDKALEVCNFGIEIGPNLTVNGVYFEPGETGADAPLWLDLDGIRIRIRRTL